MNCEERGRKMKETLEKLWQEYLFDDCALVNSLEERELTKKAGELREKLNELLSEEQRLVTEKYIDTLCDIDFIFAKKAFLKGCEFTVSFLLEAQK